MNKYYINQKNKKYYQKIFIKNFPDYKWKTVVADIFFLLAIIAFLALPVMYIVLTDSFEVEVLIEFLGGSVIFGLIPFLIGLLIKDKTFKDLLWNTVNIDYESIEITEDSILHTWHRKGDQAESMLEYNIHHDYIESVHLDKASKMLTIVGSATITPYENYAAKQVNSKYPAYSTSYKNIEQFFIAVDDTKSEAEIMKLIKAVAEERYSET